MIRGQFLVFALFAFLHFWLFFAFFGICLVFFGFQWRFGHFESTSEL